MSTIINATTTNGVVIQPDNSGSLQLATNSGTTALTISTAQNVGIGTTSPSRKLEVSGASAAGSSIEIGNTNTQSSTLAAINTTGTTYSYSGVGGSTIWYYGNKTVALGTDSANPIQFVTNAAERMRINSSGNLQVGTTSGGSERLYVTQSVDSSTAYFLNNNGTTATQYGIVVKLNGDPNNTNHMVQCIGNTTTRAEIRANGGIANYSANNVNLSDQREKTNVELASSYLDKICAIPVKTFNYIDQNMEEDGGLTLGVIAQDVQAVAPELIMESNWAGKDEPEKLRLSIYQTDLQYALMKCIQEQQTIINDLKARIETLEAK